MSVFSSVLYLIIHFSFNKTKQIHSYINLHLTNQSYNILFFHSSFHTHILKIILFHAFRQIPPQTFPRRPSSLPPLRLKITPGPKFLRPRPDLHRRAAAAAAAPPLLLLLQLEREREKSEGTSAAIMDVISIHLVSLCQMQPSSLRSGPLRTL